MTLAGEIRGVFKHRPNFLILMCDQERYPVCYEDNALRQWRAHYLQAQNLLRRNGLDFRQHYTGATACCPARATLFTGQYPSLHGVSQTDGVAKGPFDPGMFWLDPNTVPTMGDYFRAAGYRTFYKGKWHISDADITIPATHYSLPSYQPETGVPDPAREELYRDADRLEGFGFSGWIGPEPHGAHPHNSGSSARFGVSGRDVVYGAEVVRLLEQLDQEKPAGGTADPWLLVASFVNPHDIAIYGFFSDHLPTFCFAVDDTIPEIPPPPTFRQSFATRPRCQLSYRRTFSRATQPVVQNTFYRQLYYQLQKNVDQAMQQVLERLRRSSFYEDTVVVFTSDHGELLGAHGGMVQKWYCAFEEVIRVPLVIHNPRLFPEPRSTELLTSHVDILPTLLELAGIDPGEVQQQLRADHSEVQPLVGRDLSSLVREGNYPDRATEPVYFMTDDDITQGLHQTNPIGLPYEPVIQPNHVETVVAYLASSQGPSLWKYSRYFDNPQFWVHPETQGRVQRGAGDHFSAGDAINDKAAVDDVDPAAEEYELYNLTADPLEENNLAAPEYATPETRVIQQQLSQILREQCRQKRLTPASGSVPGAPRC